MFALLHYVPALVLIAQMQVGFKKFPRQLHFSADMTNLKPSLNTTFGIWLYSSTCLVYPNLNLLRCPKPSFWLVGYLSTEF